MGEFRSADGRVLHYETRGDGPLLVCQPGGPGRPPSYLDGLGGVDRVRTLVLLEPRGVGRSAAAGGGSFGELAGDLEALRVHLGVERLDLLGHSAGAWPVIQFAARHPDRVGRVVLLTPSRRPIPLAPGEPSQDELVVRWFAGEPWYPRAKAAWDAEDEKDLDWVPFVYAADGPAVRAHAGRADAETVDEAERVFWSTGFEPDRLGELTAPVTIVAGERDIVTGLHAPQVLASARFFPHAELIWLPGGGHLPWVTQPAETVAAIVGGR